MKRLTLKIALLLFFLLFSFNLLISLTISATLNSKSSVLKYGFQKFLGVDVSFERIGFGMLKGLEFRNFALKKDSHILFFIKELRVYPSLSQLSNKRFVVNKIIARDCATSLDAISYKDYILSKIYNNRSQVGGSGYNQLLGLGQRNLNIYIRNLRFYLGSLAQNKGFLLINSDIRSHLENLTSKTNIDFTQCNLDSLLFKEILYLFPGSVALNVQLAFMKEDLLVNNLVFSGDVFKVSGAGIVYDFKGKPLLDIKLISVPFNFRELINAKSKLVINGLVNFVTNIKGGIASPRLSLEMMMPKGELHFSANMVRFSNVFCNINIKNNEIVVKELSALFNYTTPILLTGKIQNFSRPDFDLTVESHKNKTLDSLTQESVNFISRTKGSLSGNEIICNTNVLIRAVRQKARNISNKEIGFQFDNLQFPLDKLLKKRGFDFVSRKLLIIAREIINEKLKHEQNIELDDFEAKFLFGQDSVLRGQIHSRGYGGIIDGWLDLQISGGKPFCRFMTKFVNLSINDLKSIYPTKSDISGILNGWLFLKFDKAVFIEGAVAIRNASISNFSLIDNVADFLRIKSIKALKDISFFASFQNNAAATVVRRFNLRNSNLDMEASFNLNNHGWLTGITHLVISRNMLEESGILKALLSIVRERAQAIDFDFKISGFTDSLRLELLEGEFREKLIKGLSGSLRSQIENEINKTISSFHERSLP